MSCPCAQYSISRAVAKDAGDIGGPYHGTFAAGIRARNASSSSARCVPRGRWQASPRARACSSVPAM